MKELSPYERCLIQDATLIHAKNRILEKVAATFAEVSEAYVQIINERLVTIEDSIPPKISRGEKYLGLPYLVLDYPRLFSTSNTLAIRTLFWWGNYFSITLQLKGIYQLQIAPSLIEAINNAGLDGWYLKVKGDMWQHSINEDYELISAKTSFDYRSVPFIKITKKIPLDEWDHIDKILPEHFKTLVQFL